MNDQQRIETAADNCEVLRARLARYEDGEGKPLGRTGVTECACGDQYPANSYGAGFMAANNGVCENCDAANSCGRGGVDERAAFEAWFIEETKIKYVNSVKLDRDKKGNYLFCTAYDYWRVWQARAALSAPSHAQDAGEVVAYWSDFSMVSVRFGDRVGTYVESCAPSHGEQVRDGWRLVPVEPTRAMRYSVENTSLASAVTRQSTQHEIGVQVYAAMLAAAPSAGSQEQGE